ncbi:MAG: J domain-containing protein [Dehalococcoidia bacterium]
MADTQVIDYYTVLNLPPNADFTGVQNAYARLSRELATMGHVDEGSSEALQRLNEAYAVLSKPETRREYDVVFLAKERAAEERALTSLLRRRAMIQWSLIAGLAGIVTVQASVLAYLFHEPLGNVLSVVFSPLG